MLVQLADAPWLDMDPMSWSRHFRCFPGQGEFPLTEFMDAVSATGYSGLLSLEIWHRLFVDDDGTEAAAARLAERLQAFSH